MVASEPSSESALLQTLKACEQSVWDALVRGDKAADKAALHESFLGVYSDGFASKDDHIGQLDHGPTVDGYALSNFELKQLGQDHALLAYRSDFLRTGKTDHEAMYVSSIWQRTGAIG